MKRWIRDWLRARGVFLYTAESLPNGVDWLHDISRHSGISRSTSPLFLDVGANCGQTVIEIERAFPQARIHAFEPFAEPLRQLRRVAANRPAVRVVPVALGKEIGETVVAPRKQSVLNTLRDSTVSRHTAPAATDGERIRVTTIDEYCGSESIDRVDVLKVDTEGFDAEVLKGAAALLARRACRYVYVEVTFLAGNSSNTLFDSVYSILSEHRYELLGLYETYSMHHFPAPNHFCNALFAPETLASG